MEVAETGQNQAAQNEEKSGPAGEQRRLTVIADSGATRTLTLTPMTTVRLLDPGLRTDLNAYLALLDRHRSEGVRHLALSAQGTGTRRLQVSFLSEMPVWKATYRLLVTGDAGNGGSDTRPGTSATMQGFSVVDNTTGEDWNGVRLSLIAGNPQSFLQPLAQPIYDRRPEIPIAANAQLTPQTHESANETVPPASSASANFGSSGAGNPAMAIGGPSEIDRPLRSPELIPRGIKMMHDTAPSRAATPAMTPYETMARGSMVPNATTTAFDDFSAYNVSDPVTIPRNGSALVPILQVTVPTENVTLWSPAAPQPLRALWITNSSPLTLDRGSFAVVEDGAFAGEGLLEPVHPGERRLLSYALDEAVRVTPNDWQESKRITGISVANGILHATNQEMSEVNYTVSNAAPGVRTVVVEEPRREGWTLDMNAQAAETTPNAYRFRVTARPHEPAHLKITQRHTLTEGYRLADSSEEQLTVYLRDHGGDPAMLAQMEPVFAAKRTVATLELRISETQTKINAIGEDQKRLREDLSALKGSAEERSLVRRYTAELNAQEDTLAGLRRELAGLLEQRAAAKAELNRRIQSLQMA